MADITLSQLLALSRPSDKTPVPQGYVSIPADKLVLPDTKQSQRIDYQGFYNPQTNQIIILGTAKPQPLGGARHESEATIKDGGIFWDTPRTTRGPNAGDFLEKPVPVAQTEELANELTTRPRSAYPNASITFVGEGAVGLAFSASSYNLRTDAASTVTVDSTVTVNSWQGRWTADGKTDTGVLDVRTPNPITGDPVFGIAPTAKSQADLGWSPGGVIVKADTGNAQVWAATVDVGSQTLVDAATAVGGKVAGKVAGETTAWFIEKAIENLADAGKEKLADGSTQAVGNWRDSPGRIATQLGWQAGLSPADALKVVNQGISQGQWNVMNGLSASGLPIDSTQFVPTGNLLTVGTDSRAYTSQSGMLVSTYKDPKTGAVMEVRVLGTFVDGKFEAKPNSVFAIGMDVNGKVIIPKESNNTTSDIGVNQGDEKSFEDFRRGEIESRNTTSSRDSSSFITANDVHSDIVKPGGTISDIWAEQKKAGNNFTLDEFKQAILDSNPGITDINAVRAGQWSTSRKSSPTAASPTTMRGAQRPTTTPLRASTTWWCPTAARKGALRCTPVPQMGTQAT